MLRGNIDHGLPDAGAAEVIEQMADMQDGRVRIERIVSEGQATPCGYWYDQEWDEWVMVLRGGAVLEFDDPFAEARLGTGDWLLIPARRRHRVRETRPGTLWLAVHGGGTPPSRPS